GVGARPQRAIFYNDRTGVLMVRATLADMEIVEKALQTIQAPDVEQMVIEVAAVEVKSREELSKLIGMMNIRGKFRTTLTTAEFGLMERTATNGGFRWLKMPRVTTLNGGPARVSMEEELSVDLTCKYRESDKTFRVAASSADPKNGRSETKSGVVYDRQTFVLMPGMEGGMLKPERVIFITPSLIDAAGKLKNTGDDQFIDLIGREVPEQ
ncbi:MAG: hypothetical protein ACXW3L_10560, partial [Limisphaerales bacterium]